MRIHNIYNIKDIIIISLDIILYMVRKFIEVFLIFTRGGIVEVNFVSGYYKVGKYNPVKTKVA